MRHSFIAKLIFGLFALVGTFEAHANYYDYRNGRTYYCQETTNAGCTYDFQCSAGYKCVSGTCQKAEVTCVKKCAARWGHNGECRQYGNDVCETNVTCIPKCTARWGHDGSCREYSEDFCTVNPKCNVNCTARWGHDGSCREYGEDLCY